MKTILPQNQHNPIPVGTTFGQWTVIDPVLYRERNHSFYNCQCSCGLQKLVQKAHLTSGRSTKCTECYRKARIKHGLTNHKLRTVWKHMRDRCTKLEHKQYVNYGGRGITVCDEWYYSLQAFYNWAIQAGYADGLSIDRINNDGNYEPSNCRWVNKKAQCNNLRRNVLVTAFGETKTIALWVEDGRCQCSRPALNYRIKHGINPEEAITSPKWKSSWDKAA